MPSGDMWFPDAIEIETPDGQRIVGLKAKISTRKSEAEVCGNAHPITEGCLLHWYDGDIKKTYDVLYVHSDAAYPPHIPGRLRVGLGKRS